MFSVGHSAIAGALLTIVIGVAPAMAAINPAIGTGFETMLSMPAQPGGEPAAAANAREPFRSDTLAISHGGMVDKWRATATGLVNDERVLARCGAEPADCPLAAGRFLAVVEQGVRKSGYEQITTINQAINQAIRPVEDIVQYGVPELWATPLVTFASNAGDCEDYAIAKYLALRRLGIEETNLRLVVVRDHVNNEGHAVAAVRHDGRWLILDNRTLTAREDATFVHFEPLFILDRHGTHRVAKQMPRLTIADSVKSLRPLPNLGVSAVTRRATDATVRRGFISQLFLRDGFGAARV